MKQPYIMRKAIALLLAPLALGVIPAAAQSDEAPATPLKVNVATPGTLAEEISGVTDDLNQVRWLVVTGTPDENDLRICRRLPNLEILDLSATTGLTTMVGCNGLEYLREVKLPDGLTSIGTEAFANCTALTTINIPDGVTELGASAFESTSSLTSVSLPESVKTILDKSFYLSGISDIDVSHVENFGDQAFYNSNAGNGNLSSASNIGVRAFCNTKLGELTLNIELQSIGSWAFQNASLTGTIVIPENVTVLNSGIFSDNPGITKVVLNKNIASISYDGNLADFYGAFAYTSPQTIECNILFPINGHVSKGMDLSECTLYVPALTLNEYLLHDKWVDFKRIEALPNDLTVLDIDREYVLKSDRGIAEKADFNNIRSNINTSIYGHLTVNRTADLNLGKYTQYFRLAGSYTESNEGGRWISHNYFGSTVIPESTVTADEVELNFSLYTNRWYFLSFPFDVNVKDIVVDEDALWVVRKYDGEARANLSGNTWQNMTDETVLKAGEGYIFNCAKENNSSVNFQINPAAGTNAFFANGAVLKSLNEYASEFAHNASWNLIGNTYPAFFNIKGIGFEAPVTVWENSSYAAYNPIDDEIVLGPFEAFFVQRQNVEGGDVLTLNPAARAHSREAALALELDEPQTRAASTAIRSLFNFHINGEAGTDRTRIVLNEEASTAYESSRDASKFMSSEESVPQIFVNNNNVRMAIDESPVGNGLFTLGTRIGKKGTYTISLDSRDALGYEVILTDNVNGVSANLNKETYTFDADASADDNRFTVYFNKLAGVDNAVADGLSVNVEGNTLNVVADEAVEIMVVTIDGKTVASEKSVSLSLTLESGIYVVKAGDRVVKVNVGK